jgi:threonine synthase
MGSIQSLKCRECSNEYEPQFKYICEECFGPLDVIYNTSTIQKQTLVSREDKTYWRYFELLPISDKRNIVNLNAGFTPLQYAHLPVTLLQLQQLMLRKQNYPAIFLPLLILNT